MWERFRKFLAAQVRNPVFPWVAVFFIGNLAIPQHGDQLELPRMLALRAMADDHSFEIGRYIDWTDEWSRTPDGRYFNNRAPGPGFVGFPLFLAVDRLLVQPRENGKVDDKGRRPWPGYPLRASLSFWLQQVPFALLVLFGANWLLVQGASLAAVNFFAIAALFGNTASTYMNNWSGHGLAATFVLALALALLNRKYFWVGLAFGFALLTDYGSAMLIPPLVAVLFFLETNPKKWALPIVLGGILPGALWIWYHVSAFGSPFRTANHFQNPMYQDQAKTIGNILGIFKPFPDMEVVSQLLFGARRGLLPTQPWALLFVPIALGRLAMHYSTRLQRQTLLFALGGFFLLLWLNSMYGGWFAGNTSGPRYICKILPVVALAAGITYDYLSKWWWRASLWAALAVAIVYRSLVFTVHPNAPYEPLWKWYWEQVLAKESLTNWMRLAIFWILLALAAWAVWKRRGRDQRNAAALAASS